MAERIDCEWPVLYARSNCFDILSAMLRREGLGLGTIPRETHRVLLALATGNPAPGTYVADHDINGHRIHSSYSIDTEEDFHALQVHLMYHTDEQATEQVEAIKLHFIEDTWENDSNGT